MNEKYHQDLRINSLKRRLIYKQTRLRDYDHQEDNEEDDRLEAVDVEEVVVTAEVDKAVEEDPGAENGHQHVLKAITIPIPITN